MTIKYLESLWSEFLHQQNKIEGLGLSIPQRRQLFKFMCEITALYYKIGYDKGYDNGGVDYKQREYGYSKAEQYKILYRRYED